VVRGLFVTGTDTGIGKTVTSAALVARFRRSMPLRYWKPVQTGIEQDDDAAEVQKLSGCAPHEILAEGVRLPLPVSPHLAARLAGQTIHVRDLVRIVDAKNVGDRWIVEGAGGVLVPLNDRELMIDLMQALALPVLLVARAALGTINHTLLTLEALRSRSLSIAGIVMTGEANAANRAAIEHYGNVRVIGEMPSFRPLEPAALQSWASGEFDTGGDLLRLLQ
jgi:dethiobiotin synthetase